MQTPASSPAITLLEIPRARPLERQRLQCYLALLVGDALALFAGFCVAGYFYLGAPGMWEAAVLAQLILPVFMTFALFNGAYSMDALDDAMHGTIKVLAALAISAAAVVFIAFYTKSSAEFSRVSFSFGVVFAALIIAWLRTQLRAFVRWRCGERVLNELVIDDGGPAFDLPGAIRVSARALALTPVLDDPAALDRIGLVLRDIDRAVVSCPPGRRLAWAMILKGANVSGEVIDDTVAELGAHGARIAAGHGWLRVSTGPLGLRARAMKRLFDVVLAAGGLVLLSPLLLLVAVAIMIEDGLPILFVQRRVGRANRFFALYKFRSMGDAHGDRDGDRSTARDDDRVTRVGRLIRRTSIDELPQLWNVLKGEMSLVGPRPHAVGSLAGGKLFWEVDPRYWHRHALKPGLTGLAQIRGLRGATELEGDLASRLSSDLEYVSGWSLWRDVLIVAATLRILVHSRAF